MICKKEISITLEKTVISPGEYVNGRIQIDYDGRFDSIVINSQIENSNDIFSYLNLNGKKTNYPYARVSILKHEVKDKNIDFVVTTNHTPKDFSNAKFRVSLIQEHKEIANDVVRLKIIKL